MAERILRGIPASPGVAAGVARVLDPRLDDAAREPVWRADRPAEAGRAEGAMRTAGEEISRVAHRLRGEGREEEAEIVATGALLALDPELLRAVRAACTERGLSAPAAILEATDAAARTLAELDDPMLAARADDVRSLGRRAVRLVLGGSATVSARTGGWSSVILVASDLGPADVAELGGEVGGIALAGGAVTAHAAIVARSLGLPMAVALGNDVTAIADGEPIVVDGTGGTAALSPSLARATQARLAGVARERARQRAVAESSLPAVTTDGRRVVVLANVASVAEAGVALDAGAEGVGLLRTELAFLDTPAWPSEEQHRRQLEPVLAPLAGRPVTVRVLDFGGDKAPRFLAGDPRRGISLLLGAPEALEAQLRAILRAGRRTELRVLLPMVDSPDQVRAVREALDRAAEAVGESDGVPLGAMIETAQAAARVREIAAVADFLSVGTNDLTASLLGRDRFGAGRLATHDPRVLEAIAATARAGSEAGLTVEVCGEAASHPLVAPLLVGLGVDELSVGAARVGITRAWVRSMSAADATELAAAALRAEGVTEVESLMRETAKALDLAERGDASDQGVNGAGSVIPLRPKA